MVFASDPALVRAAERQADAWTIIAVAVVTMCVLFAIGEVWDRVHARRERKEADRG